ncbi:hypothetical protein SAMN05421863_105524 [Nitrosomonas communis]|uniref:Uncharacterized protein n=1 Tax=Nitrosomonas communis TaxID=44574 RepID=A0A1I4TWF7_9PROT|nr:hypothetical protein SAMN05421863_105524 [Nitrosomonas communis]
MELLQHLCEELAESDQGVLEVVEWVIRSNLGELELKSSAMVSA